VKQSRKDDEDIYSKALKIISNAGLEGVLQSDLWRALNVSSREGSRIALTLERRGLIVREPVYRGRSKTFKLVAVSSNIRMSLDAIGDCPCFSCANLSRCGSGQLISPEKCEDLTRWLLKS